MTGRQIYWGHALWLNCMNPAVNSINKLVAANDIIDLQTLQIYVISICIIVGKFMTYYLRPQLYPRRCSCRLSTFDTLKRTPLWKFSSKKSRNFHCNQACWNCSLCRCCMLLGTLLVEIKTFQILKTPLLASMSIVYIYQAVQSFSPSTAIICTLHRQCLSVWPQWCPELLAPYVLVPKRLQIVCN